MVTVIPKTITIANGQANDGAIVNQMLTDSYNNEATLASAVNTSNTTFTNFTATLTGSVVFYAGISTPTGWLICDGAAVSRTTYAALFTAIGTAFGTGDGSTTFNLPDLRGRFPLGLDNMGAGAANRMPNHTTTLAATGGEEMHTLITSELAAHDHTFQVSGSSAPFGIYIKDTDGTGGTGGYTTSSTGDGAAHNTVPLYQALKVLIKT